MRKLASILAGLALLVAPAALVAAPKPAKPVSAPAKPAPPKPAPAPAATDGMTMGSPTAKVTIVEYGSVACPFCAQFNETIMPQLKAKYIDTGKVRYIYRPMLTGVKTIAASGELMAECVGPDKYFQVVDAVMRAQHEYYAMGETDMLARPVLLRIAAQFGMDEKAYVACTSNATAYKALSDRYNAYLDSGHTYTPYFTVNDKPFEYKGKGLSEFDDAIAKAQ